MIAVPMAGWAPSIQIRLFDRCENITVVAIQGADSYWHAQGFAYVGTAIEGPYGPGSHLMQRAVEAA